MRTFQAHVISCVLAEIERRATLLDNSDPVRILVAGCGRGELILELMHVFRERGSLAGRCELYGLVATDRMSGKVASCENAVKSLTVRYPEIDWKSRIRLATSEGPWPFEDRYFDITVSSQVLKHDFELGWYLEQCYRVLRRSGVGVHCLEANEMSRALVALRSLVTGPGLADCGDDCVSRRGIYSSTPLWKRVKQIGERVGFKVSPRYNGCLLRRMLNGDRMAYCYPRSQSDHFVIRLMAAWSPVTLISEKICRDS